MNIEEAKEKLHNIAYRDLQTKPYDLKLADVIQILNQIKLNKPKPEVPQFVADWIEEHKKSFSDASAIDMYDNLTSDNRGGYYHDVWLWAIDHHNDFISAWMHGYTIEKEKLYTVEIPNPNSDLKIILVKVNKKLKLIEAYEDQLEEYKNIRNVTESEIRKDFDWAWQFRKDVENE
ncbi:TPA: DUF1642 domain-containing protein [Streptococcus agalactiae]|uniref:DUF1642 domain-containing protein n=1 Tax=Streptococcus agalactiae TaxID=1311 RepID=UPI0002D8564E|nr:DUF1642 domain-containing protein [Streptococcus agalactiae]ALB16187.1 hypothetical protein AMD29_06310 [Streptococcus agalactiae]AMQ13736.1 hypothetical protein CUGBS08_00139 [Streptococcus agalactiae]ASA81976.1 hypothetical protein BB197_06400 [Streptococcus agalactiae]ASA84029.1 hypothetical protein BB194_06400 [Streptococcus agalactiae]ASA86080.1 hypothetical protein BB313_06395 [Streptococcus agalactiae]